MESWLEVLESCTVNLLSDVSRSAAFESKARGAGFLQDLMHNYKSKYDSKEGEETGPGSHIMPSSSQ